MGVSYPNEIYDDISKNMSEFEKMEHKFNKLEIEYNKIKSNISIMKSIKSKILSKKESNHNIKAINHDMKSVIHHMKSINLISETLIPKTKQLSKTIEIPLIGLGTSRISNIVDVVYNSIKDGLRLIDTAFKYGNEAEIGKGLKKALDDKLCKREELFIIGKIWIDHRSDPESALKNTLEKLQLNYIDLYMDHWPSGNNYTDPNNIKEQVPIFEFWPKMEELVEKGLARSIGVSNYNVQNLLNLLDICKIRPLVNEVEFHPYYYQKNLKDFCDKENITLIAYYPLARGNGARTYIKEHNGEMDIFKEKVVEDLVKKYNKTPGQIILNWIIKQGIVAIPGTSKVDRMKENMEALYFEMDEKDMESLCCFGKKMKFCGCKRFFGYNIMA